MEEENIYCGTKVADLDKRLKECRDHMGDINKKMNESNKRNLMIQSEAMDNYKSGPKRPPINSQSRTIIRIGGEIPHILYLHCSRGGFKNDIDNNMHDVTIIGDTPQHVRASVAM